MTDDDLSTPLWQCALCEATGEAATAPAASAAALDHVLTVHPGAGYAARAVSSPAVRGKSQWELDLEAKHRLPIEQISGMVYALHYEPPRVVRSVSTDYAGSIPQADSAGLLSAGPIRHYVGWTQQRDPRKRIGRHAPLRLTEIVHLMPGTMLDERELTLTGQCPRCGESYADSLVSVR